MAYSRELQCATDLARQSGRLMLDYFQKEFTHRVKTDGSSVTEVDEKINQLVISQIEESFPGHAVLGEEASFGDTKEAEYIWVCDPIDGTSSFMKGIPTNTFSLALTQAGRPVVAVVYDPYLDRLFTATADQATALNGEPISINGRTRLKGGYYTLADDAAGEFLNLKSRLELHRAFYEQGAKQIELRSLTYAGVVLASGQLEALVFPRSLAHDVAAIKLLIDQAGGKTTDLFGQEQRYDRATNGFVASNGVLHDTVLNLLAPYVKK